MTQQERHPRLITRLAELREALAPLRRDGRKIGLVPTMGALHEGHLSLVRTAKAQCGFVVVTIYVNPRQFGPKEDYRRYPRTLGQDLEALATCEADIVFAPTDDEVYPPGYATWIEVGPVAEPLEGACRPGHFRGVATIVLKLFNMVGADVAYFGQKDYQQTLVIRRMAGDLNVPTAVCICPTVREPDGLAMSSRNAYLSPAARRQALALSGSLKLAAGMVDAGERRAEPILSAMRKNIESVPGARIDYIALADPETLQPVDEIRGRAVVLMAVVIDGTRLIDNQIMEPPT